MSIPPDEGDADSRPNIQSTDAGLPFIKHLDKLPVEARLAAYVIAAFLGIIAFLTFTGNAEERKIVLWGLLAVVIISVVLSFWLIGQQGKLQGKLVLDAPSKGAQDGKTIKYSYDLFVAVPMAALADDTERTEVRAAVLKVIDVIKRRCEFSEIFYAAYKADIEDNFDPPALGLKHNVPRIRASKRFMLIYPKSVPTGALVELGMALGLGKPTVLFIKDGVIPPYLLREAGAGQTIKDFPVVKFYSYRNFDQLTKLVEQHGAELFDDVPARRVDSQV